MNKTVLTSFTIMCLLSTVFLIALAFNFQLVKAKPETKVYVDPPRCGGGPGNSFAIDVNIANANSVYSWTFYLSWDPVVLNVTDAQEGDFLDQGIYNTIFQPYYYNDVGYIMVVSVLQGEPRSASASGNGTFATVTFSIKGEGSTDLHLYNTDLRNYDIFELGHTTEDGYFSTELPVAIFSYLPEQPWAGNPVTFDASQSYGYEGVIVGYMWDFGDGNITVVSHPFVVHVYAKIGIYNVNLTVTDNDGYSCSRRKSVTVKCEIWVPDDHPTIQEAINAAIPGVIIHVRNGTYPEQVDVNKSVSLLGEEKTVTLINDSVSITSSKATFRGFTVKGSISIGKGQGVPVHDTVKNVTVDGNIIYNKGITISIWTDTPLSPPVFTNHIITNNIITNSTDHGIRLFGVGTNNTISGNTVTESKVGIYVEDPGNNTILHNTISNSIVGIWLFSSNNQLRNNTMKDNDYNFITISPYERHIACRINDVDTSNTINGKSIYYWVDKADRTVPFDAGYVALTNCHNITIQNLTLTDNGSGILISESTNITVRGNTLKNNLVGLLAANANGTFLEGNTIIDNFHGLMVDQGFNNTIAKNTLRNNTVRNCPYRFPEHEWLLYPPVHYWIDELIWYSGGIYLWRSSNITISENFLLNNEHGIYLSGSSFNTFKNNTMTGNVYNFGIDPLMLFPSEWVLNPPIEPQISPYLLNIVDTSNTADGKPIYYWINRNGEQVPYDAGFVVLVNSTNMIVKGLTLQNNEQGIFLFDTTNTVISHNFITGTRYGIQTRGYMSSNMLVNITITENNITKNGAGVEIGCGSLNIVSNNTFKSNSQAGIYVRTDGNILLQNVLLNNTLPPAEEWILGTCYPPHIILQIGCFSIGPAGILLEASGNTVCYNTIQNNDYGMSIGLYSRRGGNIIYHNNFIDNYIQVETNSINAWDDNYPSGGNYWSNYTGVDSDHDGLGDSWYEIDENNADHYPLMGMFYDFDVTVEHDEVYHVQVIGNSTVSNLTVAWWLSSPNQYLQPGQKFIEFLVAGENGTAGFCRVTIPRNVINGTCKVLVDWNQVTVDELAVSNSTHVLLYFTYQHSTHEVIIVPEFPSFLILPLFMIATLLTVIVYRRK